MTFNQAINGIMDAVRSGSDEPFIIYRDGSGDWHGDSTQNQYGETFEWVEDVKQNDMFALTFKGSDFADGSFPYVCDKVFIARLRAEYDTSFSGITSDAERIALINFLEDNVGEFSPDVIEYLTTCDKPFTTIEGMNPFVLADEHSDVGYNDNNKWKLLDIIENKIEKLMDYTKSSVYDGSIDVEGYKELQSQQIGGRLITLSTNPAVDKRYKICEFHRNNPFNLKEFLYTDVTDDYLEALEKYTERLSYHIGCVKSERESRKNMNGVEPVALSAEHCMPDGMNENLEGKLIIIKPEALSPEYRTADHMLKICNGGFGASPNSRGNAVFCKDLYSGKESRFERYDVLGVADIEKLPQWAKVKLADIEKGVNGKLPQNSAEKTSTLLGKLDDKKRKVAMQTVDKSGTPKKKRGEREVT